MRHRGGRSMANWWNLLAIPQLACPARAPTPAWCPPSAVRAWNCAMKRRSC